VLISELSPEMAESFSFEGEKGILVQDVTEDSPAAKAGVQSGDIIMSLDGEPVDTLPGFRAEIAKRAPGSKVKLEVWRDGKKTTLTVALGESSQAQAGNGKGGAPPKIGIALSDLTPQLAQQLGLDEEKGVVVVDVQPGSPAARAGIRPGDLIEQVGNLEVQNAKQALAALRKADVKQGVRLRIRRNGRGQFVLIRKK
jgi:serine protease Do